MDGRDQLPSLSRPFFFCLQRKLKPALGNGTNPSGKERGPVSGEIERLLTLRLLLTLSLEEFEICPDCKFALSPASIDTK